MVRIQNSTMADENATKKSPEKEQDSSQETQRKRLGLNLRHSSVRPLLLGQKFVVESAVASPEKQIPRTPERSSGVVLIIPRGRGKRLGMRLTAPSPRPKKSRTEATNPTDESKPTDKQNDAENESVVSSAAVESKEKKADAAAESDFVNL